MSQNALYDWNQALEMIGDDEELLLSVLEMFLEEAPTYLDALKNAHAQQNHAEITEAAHSLKGLLATFAAEQATQLALEIEQAGKVEQDSSAAVAALDSMMTELLASLSERAQ